MSPVESLDEKLVRLADLYHPLEAMLEVTAKCNAACPYCYLRHETFGKELDTKDMLRAIDKLDDAGVMFLGISGGEPFARADILDILRHITKKNFFKSTIITNGTLMQDEHVGFIVEHKQYFSLIRFSVFSHINEVHDRYVGVPGALEKVMGNAKKLQAGGVSVMMIINVVEENSETFQDTWRIFEDMGFIVMVGLLKEISTPQLKKMLKPVTSEEFFSRAFSRMKPKERMANLADIRRKIAQKDITPGLCSGLTGSIAVECTGTIIPCASFRDKKIGHIFEDKSLPEILRSSKELAVLRSMDKTMIDGCRECEYINACDICLGMSYTEHGTLYHRPEQFCNYINGLIKSEKS
jgi:radical SAM protein with 4Fe4S-binding SPASM domain